MKHDPKEILSAVNPQAMSAAAAYKTLLVPMDASERSARCTEVACQMSVRFGAPVIGLYDPWGSDAHRIAKLDDASPDLSLTVVPD